MGGDPEKDDAGADAAPQSENILQKSQDLLAKFPPDWEECERYAKTMVASKSLSTFADFTKPDTFCLSNLQPIPTDEQRFSTCGDTNESFGEMGSIGIPLFFEFNKCLAYMFCCTTIFYFIPIIGLVGLVASKYLDQMLKDPSANSQSLAVSIGVFLYDPIMAEANLTTGQKGFGIRYLAFSDRK